MTLLGQGAKCFDGDMNTMNDDNDDEIVVATGGCKTRVNADTIGARTSRRRGR